MKTTEICENLCKAKIESMGFELCDVEYQKEYGDWVLTFYIDKPQGVTIDECEEVSRAIEPILDEADPIESEYVLSVSSLGIDRPLKKDRDFERAMGTELEIKLYAPQGGKKQWIGTLTAYDADSFTVETESGETLTVKKKDCALVRPNIRF
ncbi:MAG: ribosome maturation factor RimP [Clostridia bacterium]|jgi:ribosome maturation factor RimP|nr:ribosome maturation factor RimP [Clostridia bacterium]MBR0507946.1 ribosome maturation factor RimP [Clostridia bacterium]